MKKVIFLFCEEAFFGYFSPLSVLTEANLQRAVSSLQCGQSDFLYIAIDHFSNEERENAKHYFYEYFIDFYPELSGKIYVSSSNLSYAERFVSYLAIFQSEIHCSVLARIGRKREVSSEITAANLTNEKIKKPVFLGI